ncbi:MAG: ATP-binding cassette domain-containing protein [Mariprofundaceae bacterium]|nr:ATP-binding cassette domain-containing protein [Mariprofundaceae bacterium]
MNTEHKIQDDILSQGRLEKGPLCGTEHRYLEVRQLNLRLSGRDILRDVSFSIGERGISVLVGPSGAGKSSLLQCINLLYREEWVGHITLAGNPIKQWGEGTDALRRKLGMIHQQPVVFPCSIRENVLFGLRGRQRQTLDGDWVENCLRQAALWDEVKDRLGASAGSLSVGQQQRLCIARALALSPSMLMLDEPTSSLDPHSRQLIEQSLLTLGEEIPLLCVSHDMQQAKRLGGHAIFMCNGMLIEQGASDTFFNHPQRLETREFLRWSVCDC